DLYPPGLRPAAPRDGRVRDGRAEEKDSFPQSRAASVQHQGPDRAPSLGLRAAHPGADSQAQGGLDLLRRQCRERHVAHGLDFLDATAFALGCVLKDGEPANSERAMAQAGPRAAVMLHRAADEALAGLKPGVAMLSTPEIKAYIELARGFEPKDAPYLENHRGHLMFVKEEEKKFVTADLIANTSFTASEAEIKKRIEALRGAGYTQFTIQLVPGQEHALVDWARIRKAFA